MHEVKEKAPSLSPFASVKKFRKFPSIRAKNSYYVPHFHQLTTINHRLPIAVVTLEPLGKRRKEYVPPRRNIGCGSYRASGRERVNRYRTITKYFDNKSAQFVIETPPSPLSMRISCHF